MIFRPQVAVAYLEQEIEHIRPIAARHAGGVPALTSRMYEQMRARLRCKYQIKCCDIAAGRAALEKGQADER